MLSLHECLSDIACVSNAPITWIAPHKPILVILERMLSRIDIMSLHGAFEDFVDGKPVMKIQYWSMSFDPAVRRVQGWMLLDACILGRVDVPRALCYAGWATNILEPERVACAIAENKYELVEFYAEMYLVRGFGEAAMKCFKHIDAKMAVGTNMRALMMRMPKQLLERIAIKFMGTCDSWLHYDILDIVNTADYHLLHSFGCDVNTSALVVHKHTEHGDSTLYQYKNLTAIEERHKAAMIRHPGAFPMYSWVPEFARRVKELAADGRLDLGAQTYVQHDNDITTQYSVQHISSVLYGPEL